MRLRAITALLLLGVPAWGEVERRVWFILDNTKSMKQNDPNGLAKLSAHLFYELLDPNRGMDAFHLSTLDGRQFAPTNGDELHNYLSNVTNNVNQTFYVPAIRDALAGLGREHLVSQDDTLRKIIVFVTDGEPDDRIDAARDLAASLAGGDTHLYILLYGTGAASGRPKVTTMFPPGRNIDILDDDGSRVLSIMAGIFGRSFGALVDTAQTNRSSVDLSHKLVSKAAVIAYWTHQSIPSLELRLPNGAAAPGISQSDTETGSAYSLKWLNSVVNGSYGVHADPGVSTLLLRFAPYHLEACDPATHKPLNARANPRAVLAGETSDFYFLAPGNPETVVVSARARATGSEAIQFQENVCQSHRSETPEGLLFHVECHFPKLGAGAYPGVIEVTPSQNEVENSAAAARAEVQIYPYMKVMVDPPRDSLAGANGSHRLQRDERGCASFHFRPESGELPGADKPQIRLQAMLDESARAQTAYRQESATLDGEPLEFDGGQGDWARGKAVPRESFFQAPHEFCAVAGLAHGDSAAPVTLPIRFSLTGYPYNELPVIAGFQADAEVQPPAWWELWGNALWLIVGMAACLVLGFALLRTNFLPANLACRSWLAQGGGESYTPLVRNRLAPLVRDRRTLLLDNGSFTGGTIRATHPDLFEFLPAPGITLAIRTGAAFDGGYRLRVHENFQLESPRGTYIVRIEYAG